MGSCNVPHTIWALSVQLLWRLLHLQTDKQSFYLEVFNSILSNHINFFRRVLFIWQILPHIVVCVLYSFLLQDKSQPGTWNEFQVQRLYFSYFSLNFFKTLISMGICNLDWFFIIVHFFVWYYFSLGCFLILIFIGFVESQPSLVSKLE